MTIDFLTNGTGTSQLASQSVGTAEVRLQGKVYRLAQGEAEREVTLAPIREGSVFLPSVVGVSNIASPDGYSDDLKAVISSTSPAWSALGIVERMAAGSGAGLNSPLSVNYVGDTSRAGLMSTKVTVAYTSLGQSGTGLADAAPVKAADEVTVQGKIFRLAEPAFEQQVIDLGSIRAGERFAATTARIVNNAAADGF
jgi:hypothetical protein